MTNFTIDFNPNRRQAKDFVQPRNQILSFFLPSRPKLELSAQVFPQYVRVVDLSHWNTVTDFKALKDSGIVGVILKATESNWFVDDKLNEFYNKAVDAGLVVMLYHFFRGSTGGGEQADWYLRNTRRIRESIPTRSFGDFETADGVSMSVREGRAYIFLQELALNEIKIPGMYSSQYLWQNLYGNPAWAYEYIGWTAHWADVDSPLIPRGWDVAKTLFWQNGIYPIHTWITKITGVSNSTDHNYFLGTEAELRQFVGYDVTPTPPEYEEPIGIVKVVSKYVNVREEPQAGSKDLGDIVLDSKWYVFEQKKDEKGNDWVRIGINAWSAMNYNYSGIVRVFLQWVS